MSIDEMPVSEKNYIGTSNDADYNKVVDYLSVLVVNPLHIVVSGKDRDLNHQIVKLLVEKAENRGFNYGVEILEHDTTSEKYGYTHNPFGNKYKYLKKVVPEMFTVEDIREVCSLSSRKTKKDEYGVAHFITSYLSEEPAIDKAYAIKRYTEQYPSRKLRKMGRERQAITIHTDIINVDGKDLPYISGVYFATDTGGIELFNQKYVDNSFQIYLP